MCFVVEECRQPGAVSTIQLPLTGDLRPCRGLILHTPGIPVKDWALQALGTHAWLFLLTEMHPRDFW